MSTPAPRARPQSNHEEGDISVRCASHTARSTVHAVRALRWGVRVVRFGVCSRVLCACVPCAQVCCALVGALLYALVCAVSVWCALRCPARTTVHSSWVTVSRRSGGVAAAPHPRTKAAPGPGRGLSGVSCFLPARDHKRVTRSQSLCVITKARNVITDVTNV